MFIFRSTENFFSQFTTVLFDCNEALIKKLENPKTAIELETCCCYNLIVQHSSFLTFAVEVFAGKILQSSGFHFTSVKNPFNLHFTLAKWRLIECVELEVGLGKATLKLNFYSILISNESYFRPTSRLLNNVESSLNGARTLTVNSRIEDSSPRLGIHKSRIKIFEKQ